MSEEKIKTYIVCEDGKTCKAVNKFETYSLTEQMEPGTIFIGKSVKQAKYTNEALGWRTIDKDFKRYIHRRDAIEPIPKAIGEGKEEKEVPKECKCPNGGANFYGDCIDCGLPITTPLQAVDANKEVETVDMAADRHAKYLYDNNKVEHFQSHFIPFSETVTPHFKAGAQWQQSRSVESIVGFVLEWVFRYQVASDGKIERYSDVIERYKKDIIKELKNGK